MTHEEIMTISNCKRELMAMWGEDWEKVLTMFADVDFAKLEETFGDDKLTKSNSLVSIINAIVIKEEEERI